MSDSAIDTCPASAEPSPVTNAHAAATLGLSNEWKPIFAHENKPGVQHSGVQHFPSLPKVSSLPVNVLLSRALLANANSENCVPGPPKMRPAARPCPMEEPQMTQVVLGSSADTQVVVPVEASGSAVCCTVVKTGVRPDRVVSHSWTKGAGGAVGGVEGRLRWRRMVPDSKFSAGAGKKVLLPTASAAA